MAFDHAAAGLLIRSGDNGVLAPLGDARAFVAHAAWLAGDEPLRRVMGARAMATASALGWDCVVASFEAHLAGACGSALPTHGEALPMARGGAA